MILSFNIMDHPLPELRVGALFLSKKYQVMKRISSGSYGAVYEVENVHTLDRFAAKLEHFSEKQLENEIRILRRLKYSKYVP